MNELQEAMTANAAKFKAKFGREPGPEDPVLFDPNADTPTALTEKQIRHLMLSAFLEADTPPHLIYAFDKTGRILTQETLASASHEIQAEWHGAMAKWEEMTRQQRRSYIRTLRKSVCG